MGKFKVVITDREYENIDNELRILKQIDADVYDYQLRDPHEIAKVAADADAVIFQYANITRELIEQMPKMCIRDRPGRASPCRWDSACRWSR